MNEAVMWIAYANMLKIMNDMLKQRRPQPQPCPPCQECPECPEQYTHGNVIDLMYLNGSNTFAKTGAFKFPTLISHLNSMILLSSFNSNTNIIMLEVATR